ncbi:hypothetical protein Tco_0539872 [Tanacetum coccineum]
MANLDFYDKHNMVVYLQKSKGSEGFHQIIHFLTTSHIRYALTESPTIYVSLIKQFWQTTSTSTLENGDIEITATIDGKVKVVSEASIRRHLELEDSDCISILPTSEIFKQLTLIGAPSTLQPPSSPPSMQTTHVVEEAATMPYDLPLLRVYSLRSDKGSMTLNELTIEDDAKKEELRDYLDIIPGDDEAVNVESLATKGDGSTKSYKIFTEMLDDFDRQDVLDLYRLVKERFKTASPEGYDRLL